MTQWENEQPSNWDTQQQPVVGQGQHGPDQPAPQWQVPYQQPPGHGQPHDVPTGQLPQVPQVPQWRSEQPAQPSNPSPPQWHVHPGQPAQPAAAPQQQWQQQPIPPAPPQPWQPSPPGQPQPIQWQQPVPPAPRPPAKKSRAGLWIGLAAGATVVVVLAACGVAFALARSKPDPFQGLAASPAASRPSSRPSRKPASAVTMVRPEKIGSRNRITTGELATKAAKAEENLKSSLKPGGTLVVAYYGTTDRKADQIYIVASTIPGPVLKTTFDKQFENTGPSIGGQPTTNIVDISVGALGGYTKCGQTTQDGIDVAVCAFTNEYDYGVVQWYNRKLNEDIKKEILTIRTLLEK